MKNGNVSSTWIGKIHSDDVKAFGVTTGLNSKAKQRHRNGHRLLGNAQELNQITGKNVFLILPRWNKTDIKKLNDNYGDSQGQKEFINLIKNKELDILTMDDIDFGGDKVLQKEFKRIRKVGIDLDAKLSKDDSDKLMKCCLELKWGLYKSKYRIIR
jgi:hypothetical protein